MENISQTLEVMPTVSEQQNTKVVKKVKKKKKKKKKTSYAKMMADIMKPSETQLERRETHSASLMKNLGGGSFSKMEKI